MKNKPSVPPTKVEKKSDSLKFNLSMMVSSYYIAKVVNAMFAQTEGKYRDSESWFQGLLKGYDDWFSALGIDQDLFTSVLEKIDRVPLDTKAKSIFQNIVDVYNPIILIPGQKQDVTKFLKQQFDRSIK